MSARQAVILAVLAVVGGAVAAAPAVGVVGLDAAETNDGPAQVDNGTENANTTSLGAQLSSFMQTSAAEANGSVDAGMWSAKFNDTPDERRANEVDNRVRTLERRLERTETRMAALEAAHDNGSIPDVAYLAQASRLNSEIESLETAINDTDAAAEEAGVNDTRLDALRERAQNASGQEVARTARNLTVVRAGQRGPPADVGPDANRTGPPGDVGPGENGPPADAGPANQSDRPGQNGPADDNPGAERSQSGTNGSDRAGQGQAGEAESGPADGDANSGEGTDANDAASDGTDDSAGLSGSDRGDGSDSSGGGSSGSDSTGGSSGGGPGNSGGGGPPT